MMRWKRLGAAASLAIVSSMLQSCYSFVPLAAPAPTAGEIYAFEITDRGRVDLAERFGPGLKEIEGRLASNESAQYVINVSRISHLNGESAQWSGETTRINRDYIGTVRERKLSRGRTTIAVLGATAVAAVILGKTGLLGTFTGEPAPPDSEPPIMIRIPIRP